MIAVIVGELNGVRVYPLPGYVPVLIVEELCDRVHAAYSLCGHSQAVFVVVSVGVGCDRIGYNFLLKASIACAFTSNNLRTTMQHSLRRCT